MDCGSVFIESFSRKGTNRALTHLTGVKNLEDAESSSARTYSSKPDGIHEYENADDGLTVDDLIGWSLLDAEGKAVGEITDYEDIPGNT